MWISPTAVCWTSAEGSILAGYVVELLVVLDTPRWRRGDSSAEPTPCARHRALDLGELPDQGRGGQAVSLRGPSELLQAGITSQVQRLRVERINGELVIVRARRRERTDVRLELSGARQPSWSAGGPLLQRTTVRVDAVNQPVHIVSGHGMRIDHSDGEALRTVRRVLPRERR